MVDHDLSGYRWPVIHRHIANRIGETTAPLHDGKESVSLRELRGKKPCLEALEVDEVRGEDGPELPVDRCDRLFGS